MLINETARAQRPVGVDVAGPVLVTAALISGVYAIVKATHYGWTSAHTLGFGALAVALLVGFVAVEARIAHPMFPLRILRVPGLAFSSVVRAFLVTGMFSTFLLGVLYLQHVHGYGALSTGLAFLPMTLILGASSLGPTARLMTRFGASRVLPAGMAFTVLALVGLARVPAHASYFPDVFVPFVLLGVGAGLSFLPLTTIAMADVPLADAGLASGIVNASLQISAAIGIAALSSAAASRTTALARLGDSSASALTGGFHLAWIIGASAVAAGGLLALSRVRPPRRAVETLAAADAEEAGEISEAFEVAR
jgi:hypothetical protein